MESLEEFSNNKLSSHIDSNANNSHNEIEDKKKSRKNLIVSIEEQHEKNRITEEIEFEYLKKLI